MSPNTIQPSLFPEPEPTPKPAGFDTMDVDVYADRVAASAPSNPYIEQENLVRRSVGLPVEQADIVHGHGRAAEASSEAVTDISDTEAVQTPVQQILGTLALHRPEGYKPPVVSRVGLDHTIDRRRKNLYGDQNKT